MKIISIANQKGGCGKTTTAINLASALSLNDKKILLIDLDPQAHASLGLNIKTHESIYNVISKLTPRKLSIENIIKRVEDRFDIIPSSILVGTLEQELADEIGRELKLVEVLKPIKDRYDYILIDCPPSLGILTVNAIRVSDEIIVPVETSRFSMQGVEHLTDIVNLVKERLNHEVICRILITMFDSRLRHSFAMLSTMKEQFRDMLFDTIVHINVKLKESAVMGKTVASYDKYSRGSKDYYTLAKEILLLEKESSVSGTKREEKLEWRRTSSFIKLREKESRKPEPQEESEIAAVSNNESSTIVNQSSMEQHVSTSSDSNFLAKDKLEDAAKIVSKLSSETPPKKEPAFQPFSVKMQELVEEQSKELSEIRFSLEAKDERSVYVTGSFNDWSLEDRCRMKRVNGMWEAQIPLKPGLYKYQFIVDGVWREDPYNPRKERNSFGDINSLIEVTSTQ